MSKVIQHGTPDSELTHSMAHYLFSIHELKEKNGYARVTDIAKELKLTKGSVSIALNNLKKKELVSEDENKFFSLSEKGHQVVHYVLSSRTLLYYFLKDFIGVNKETAQKDACLMEHLISEETRDKFFYFMKELTSEPNKTLIETLNIKTTLNLSEFDSAKDFTEIQGSNDYILDGV